ncbi:MAG TPA: hypothetical protein DCP90_06085 [Clostridiales bacterium]|nr:MAG: hypothetical protein A2Y22_09215 [Clostridiales bacterium GWD2_32_59]HAN10163.1 hypothetical protein [Clostridiales bacterium]
MNKKKLGTLGKICVSTVLGMALWASGIPGMINESLNGVRFGTEKGRDIRGHKVNAEIDKIDNTPDMLGQNNSLAVMINRDGKKVVYNLKIDEDIIPSNGAILDDQITISRFGGETTYIGVNSSDVKADVLGKKRIEMLEDDVYIYQEVQPE